MRPAGTDPVELDLLVVTAPTHNLGLLEPTQRVLTSDTVAARSIFSGSSAKAEAHALKRRGFPKARRSESFLLAGRFGPARSRAGMTLERSR